MPHVHYTNDENCKHPHVHYCAVCDIVYCDNCGKSWNNTYEYMPSWINPLDSGSSSGIKYLPFDEDFDYSPVIHSPEITYTHSHYTH